MQKLTGDQNSLDSKNGKRPIYCGCSKATIWGTGWSPVSH